jgi:hypothetical protein
MPEVLPEFKDVAATQLHVVILLNPTLKIFNQHATTGEVDWVHAINISASSASAWRILSWAAITSGGSGMRGF